MEQREIKVPFIPACFRIASFSILLSLFRSFQISLLVIYPVTQFSVIGVCVFFFFLTLSSLIGVGGARARLSSHLHPSFFIRCFPPLQFISLVSTQ